MAATVVNEEENKAWLATVKGWVERGKQIPSSILFTEEGSSVLEDFQNHEEKLAEYLVSLDAWLTNNGMKKALAEMPSVGFLLSQLCKLTLAPLSDSIFKQLAACIIHLSDILNAGKQSDDPALETAKKWAVDHFCAMNSVDVDGVDMFLMEEFGVSPEEYLDEHVRQSSLELLHLLPSSCTTISVNQKELSNMFDVLQMAYNIRMSSAFEGLLHISDGRVFIGESLSNTQLGWLMQSTELITQFAIPTLHLLFSQNVEIFEEYVINVIEQVTETYPFLHQEVIEGFISKSRLIDICAHDMRYQCAVLRIIKDSFILIGFHPGLVHLLHIFVKRTGGITALPAFSCKSSNLLEKILMISPESLAVSYKEEIIQRVDQLLSEDMEKSVLGFKNNFEIWFQLAQYTDWIDEAIALLFDGSRQIVLISMKLLLRFFYPTNLNCWKSYLAPAVSLIFALRNLLPKNHVAFSDILYLLSIFKGKIPPESDMKIILMIFGMVFLVKCNGSETIAESYVEHIFKDICDDESTYWFLYTFQLFFKDVTLMSKKVAFKGALSKCMDQLLVMHTNNGDEISSYDNKVISVSNSRRESASVTCRKLQNYVLDRT